MHNRKAIKCLVLLTALCVLTSCSSAINESAAISTTMVDSDTSVPGTAETTDTALPVGITYTTDEDGRTIATGTTPEGIPVSAVILANRDLKDPGEASSYEIQTMLYDETDRGVLVGKDWTLLESSTDDQYYLGTLYYDVYSDSQNRQWSANTFPENLQLFTDNGMVIESFLGSSSEKLEEQGDLPFASVGEDYQKAKDFFTNAGYDISDSYDIFRYTSTWLGNSAKLARTYGEDMTEYDRLYPDGFLPENGAYLLKLRQDIDGLPILTGEIGKLLDDGEAPSDLDAERMLMQWTQALVTSQGVESATIFNDLSVGNVIETGEMISFEDALHTVSQNFFSGNPNEGLYQLIYQYCMLDLSANVEGTITPAVTESYQPVTGTVSIEKAELGLLPLVKGADNKGQAIPCWEFLFVWQRDPNDPKSGESECWVAVNALTGEYIPATTSWGEI